MHFAAVCKVLVRLILTHEGQFVHFERMRSLHESINFEQHTTFCVDCGRLQCNEHILRFFVVVRTIDFDSRKRKNRNTKYFVNKFRFKRTQQNRMCCKRYRFRETIHHLMASGAAGKEYLCEKKKKQKRNMPSSVISFRYRDHLSPYRLAPG